MLNSFIEVNDDIIEGTKEYYEFRKKHIGCSEIGSILGLSPFKSAYNLWLEKCEFIQPPERTDAMLRGMALESTARDVFIENMEIAVIPKRHLYKKWPILLASYDGISSDNKVLLEIKCPSSPKLYEQAKEKYIPEYYFAQMQYQLLVSSADVCFYMVYVNNKEYQLIEVFPDYKYMEDNFYKIKEFWDMMDKRKPPKRVDGDPFFINIEEVTKNANEYKKIKNQINELENLLEEKSLELKKYINNEKHVIFGDSGLKATTCEGKNNIDWKKVAEDYNIDENILDKYRKKSNPYILFKL